MPAVADQRAVAKFLGAPETYGVGRVERIDTHGALVFLAGDRAYKIKRAVKYPYMDFSTLERRRLACEREVELNRRTAPDLYLGVRPIVRARDGRLSFDGPGEIVEWAVLMHRFDQDGLFDRLAGRGRLTPTLMRQLADAITDFHERAEPVLDPRFGGASGIRQVVDENGQEFSDRPDLFSPERVVRLTDAARAELDRIAPLLDRRRTNGLVRRCHGDLHLRNICMIGGQPRLFDAIEFNDAIACIDILYDLAFLIMDLDQRELRELANIVFNRYFQHSGDLEGLAAFPAFLSTRAAIRAKVAASAEASQARTEDSQTLREEAARYFAAAIAYLSPSRPSLVAVGGLSGTGKTALARRLAPLLGRSPGALHLRSDVIRKSLFAVAETARLPEEAYGAAAAERVYRELCSQADSGLRSGQSVIADAVFSRPGERHAIEKVADKLQTPFTGVWLEASPELLVRRVLQRADGAADADASDADTSVVEKQLRYDIGPLTWHKVDANRPLEAVLASVRAPLSAT
jgi:aminoglycoside phosphotransferase family enzyme